MSDLLAALTEATVAEAHWAVFWDRLAAGRVRREEAAAVLATLSAAPPDVARTYAFVTSLRARRAAAPTLPGCVSTMNAGCVSTNNAGGRTIHIGTAAALVAAAMGVPVVKAGSSALTSHFSSIDVLERMGVPVAATYEQLAEQVAAYGIGFAGSFVHPAEIGILARRIFPLEFRIAGRFVDQIGPLLAELPAAPQLTGVGDAALIPVLQQISVRDGRRRWLASNAGRVPALISVAANTVHDGVDHFPVEPDRWGLGGGDLTDLTLGPAADPAAELRSVLAGVASPTAVHTVCLNAAALAVLAGHAWSDAVDEAYSVLAGGAAAHLLDRLCRHTARPRPTSARRVHQEA